MFFGAGAKFIVFVCWRISTEINDNIWCYSKDTSVQSEIILMQISIMCQKNSPLTPLTSAHHCQSSMRRNHIHRKSLESLEWTFVVLGPCWLCVFLLDQESAGESFYMLFRAIKHQVDKGPVDAVTGKAKYTLNDNRLLREDVEYRTLVSTHMVTRVSVGVRSPCILLGSLKTD